MKLEASILVTSLIYMRWVRLNRVVAQLTADGFWPLRTVEAVSGVQQAMEENKEADQDIRDHFLYSREMRDEVLLNGQV